MSASLPHHLEHSDEELLTPARDARPWLTRDELADRLGVSARTVQRHLTAGRFPHHRIGIRSASGPDTRQVRFSPEDVATIEARFFERVPGGEAS